MRMAIWHAGNTISNIISGFLAAGILHNMEGIGNLHAWQWFFLIEGAVSIVVACVAFFLLPNWPTNTKWLSPQESEMAQYRVLVSSGGKDEGVGGTWDGVKDAVRDPFTWMFCGMHFSLINAQSFNLPIGKSSLSKRLPCTGSLTYTTDSQDLRLRRTNHLSRPSPTLCNCIHHRLSFRLLLRSLRRILLPHHRAHHRRSNRMRNPYFYPQRYRTIHRCNSSRERYLQRSQLATVLGNQLSSGTAK